MTKDEASRFRGLVARVNYLSLDRPDLQFAAKTASQHMAQPKVCDSAKIKRIARYLVKATRAVQKFSWQEKPTQIKTYVDSDWAGNKITRKSTSGGAMFLGKHLIKSWSSTQHVMALSSGEAELYGMLKGATQTKRLISMMADFGEKVVATVCSDASAAIGIAHRQGLGKTRHIEVQYLWIQHEVKEGKLIVKKVGTNNNPADLLTKAMNDDKMMKYMAEMGFDIDRQQSRQHSSIAVTDDKLACSVTKQTRRSQRRALRPRGDVRIRSPDSESAACASRVEKPNPTGDDHKWRQ